MAGMNLQASAETEAQRVVARLLAPPVIKTAPGFSAEVLVPPGQLYDPLFAFPHDGAVWLTDDGGEAEGPAGRTGSRVVSVDAHGHVSVIVPYTTTVPMIAGNFAPPGFGNLAGQLIMFSQPKADFDGAFINHVIQRLDPANHYAPTVVCTLPKAGELGKGVPGAGVDARFGPPGSPFGDRFFSATLLNGVVYQMNGAGECAPFADFSKLGGPAGIAFTPDGKQMLVTTQAGKAAGELSVTDLKTGGGLISRVAPDGKIDDQPFAKGLDAPMGLDVAPRSFGSYGGQVFVADLGPSMDIPVIMTQREKPDGKVYRVTPDGQLHLVASGFLNPIGVKFIGDKLWVTDVAGDFIGGKRELPDGFIVVITAK
ncbi:MAG: hypothetical protein ACREDI_02530 [Roseiarcus sp.]